MRYVYELTHSHLVETDEESGEKICDTKLLGFFSSKEKCQEAILQYLEQPGFEKYPDNFIIEEVEADVNDFNDFSGVFQEYVYYLSHEWYDGEYDYVSSLGYYSSAQKAKEAKAQYCADSEFIEHQDGFGIDKYKIDEREWVTGFISRQEAEE